MVVALQLVDNVGKPVGSPNIYKIMDTLDVAEFEKPNPQIDIGGKAYAVHVILKGMRFENADAPVD